MMNRFMPTPFLPINWIIASLALVPLIAIGNTPEPLAGLSIILSSTLEYHQEPVEQHYRIVKSAIKKANNQWRAKEEWLSGRVERKTYLLPDALNFDDAERALEVWIENDGAKILFQCRGLDCGSSNGFANVYLNVKQLYGLDVYQHYMVLERSNSTRKPTVEVIYLVQRGNRRVYLQYDRVSVDEAGSLPVAEESVVEAMAVHRALTLLKLEAQQLGEDGHASTLAGVVRLLRQHPEWRLYVVGHIYGAESPERKLQQSERLAKALAERLVSLGAPPKQLSVHGLGSLAPNDGGLDDRVELVLDNPLP